MIRKSVMNTRWIFNTSKINEPMNGGGSFAIQIKGEGVAFPITIGFSGVVITPVDPLATARLTVDVGENPLPGDLIEVNQTVDLVGYPIQLLSLSIEFEKWIFISH